MEFSDSNKMLLREALGMAREDGFVVVAVAFNENDNSIQFLNNDGMSRARMTNILKEAAEAGSDNSRRMTKEDKPNLYKGDA